MTNFYNKEQEQEFRHIISNQYRCTDVIGEKLGGKILSVSDEWFAAAENLIKPNIPIRDATRFTHSGAWYDGWETRRHNESDYDWVIIKMGVNAAQIVGGEIDTAFFNGNHAPCVSIEGLYIDPNEDKLIISEKDPRWVTLIDNFECSPSQNHCFIRGDGLTEEPYTHIKLKMYPDGGIARFRLYGKVIPPTSLNNQENIIDLAYVGNGGVALDVSDEHFGCADNLLLPGRGHDMSDGWETKRSRELNHSDWAIIQLGHMSNYINKIIIDTAHYRGNFPQYITVQGSNGHSSAESEWIELVSKSKTGPDKIHEFTVDKNINIDHVKLTIIPDGGVKRLRVLGN
ncbi:Allantoicase [Monosporozyma unispora]|nr:Allantoicase [Kazachstania unispora]